METSVFEVFDDELGEKMAVCSGVTLASVSMKVLSLQHIDTLSSACGFTGKAREVREHELYCPIVKMST